MNKKAYQNSQDYFKEVFEKLNKDRKYVSEARKVHGLEKVESDINTEMYVYEITCKIDLVNDNIRDMSKIEIERRFKNHFGDWFAMLEGGSRNIKVNSVEDNQCRVKIRYISENKIF